jgi:hypothetical protein
MIFNRHHRQKMPLLVAGVPPKHSEIVAKVPQGYSLIESHEV